MKTMKKKFYVSPSIKEYSNALETAILESSNTGNEGDSGDNAAKENQSIGFLPNRYSNVAGLWDEEQEE